MAAFREENYEDAVLLLLENLGYERLYGPEIDRNYTNPLHMDVLKSSLETVNKGVDTQAIEEAINKLTHIEHPSLTQKNRCFTDWMQNGIEVSCRKGGDIKTEIVRLIDFDNPTNNNFHAINQWTIQEYEVKRPDVVIFVNGLPLVVVELKSSIREDADCEAGYLQLKNYMKEIPSLFQYNAFSITSDMVETRVGTISAGYDRFVEWKTKDGSEEDNRIAAYDTLFEGMLEKSRFFKILKHFIVFSNDMPEDVKILAAYHQFYAVLKAIESTKQAIGNDGKGGVFWHTQGSGKSLSMVFYAGLLNAELSSPTIVVITDRNDLDNQLFNQFSACSDFLRQTPVQATDKDNLKELLEGRAANGIFFTTMQKFEQYEEALSTRDDIIVMADEAHRSQYNLTERVTEDGRVVIGAARRVRECLPNATYIGFTGTPLARDDKSTVEIFGNYIDVYDMTQAVEDGATRPVYYESRVMNLKLEENVLAKIDLTYELLSQNADEVDIEKSKRELGTMEAILSATDTIDTLCQDIIEHYETNRADLLTGKAMIVSYSRAIALQIYRRILELRPGWDEKVKVVMTSSNKDPEGWRDIIGNKSYKQELARKFKDNDDPMKIAIVVDMWLTGFDVPSLATMYFYKPMAGHNLMQAIARVNRVFKDKEGGLIVDYVGIASALKQAMNDYTKRDRKNYGDMDIAKTAYPRFQEKLQVCNELFHGFDYSRFTDEEEDNKVRADVFKEALNFIYAKSENDQHSFREQALLMKQARSLCQSLLTKEERMESAFFEAVRVALGKVSGRGKLSFKEIYDQISEILKQSVQSEGVINIFSDRGEVFSLTDEGFLEEISKMKEKNLAQELLQKLLSEQISLYKRTNLVKAEKFSERMQKIMNAYRNGQISNLEVIERLMDMAGDIKEANDEGRDLGLTQEEMAFYDALTKPEAIKDFYSNDVLKAMTQELAEELRKSQTIDWQRKESARAGMRVAVKKLLKKYKYPPEGQEAAIETVIAQCELFADQSTTEYAAIFI